MISQVTIGFIRLYRRICFFTAGHCRFSPSCSDYAIDAINKHGTLKGMTLALWRLLRCSPLSHGGHDPVK